MTKWLSSISLWKKFSQEDGQDPELWTIILASEALVVQHSLCSHPTALRFVRVRKCLGPLLLPNSSQASAGASPYPVPFLDFQGSVPLSYLVFSQIFFPFLAAILAYSAHASAEETPCCWFSPPQHHPLVCGRDQLLPGETGKPTQGLSPFGNPLAKDVAFPWGVREAVVS